MGADGRPAGLGVTLGLGCSGPRLGVGCGGSCTQLPQVFGGVRSLDCPALSLDDDLLALNPDHGGVGDSGPNAQGWPVTARVPNQVTYLERPAVFL
ncbi:MAG: hypothetical protein IGQ88_12325 [Gloeomargaritaceae cyanobacterium C42_A2020_066]|nr:hypothetical protein [Gloeomargaritaceae cyanobacterium C42_A2020_066]